jgi:signal peptidase I
MAKAADNKRMTKTEEHKGGIGAWFKELGIIVGAFLILNSFVLASFEVPTGSMENEIMTGDFLLVNKFVFGGTTPRTIPFTNIRLPAFKLPSFWHVDRGDVIVFMFPGYRDEAQPEEFAYYLKRCVALAGDTLRIVHRVVSINVKPIPVPRNIKFNSPLEKPQGYADSRIFPKDAPWNEDNYGPLVIPRKGDKIRLTPETYPQWDVFIRREGHTADMQDGRIFIDGNEQPTYTVERDYAFGMGDNRDNSLDSRFWGFIPVDAIVGTPLMVYWSWDPDSPIFRFADKLSTVRWNRFGTLVK